MTSSWVVAILFFLVVSNVDAGEKVRVKILNNENVAKKPEQAKLTNTFPPQGLYVVVRNDALIQTADLISLQIGDEANAYTTMPDYSGQTSSASYTFSSFDFNIDLEGPTFSSTGAPALTITWDLFQFVFVFNYHICSNSWPNPCEDGWVEVYTTDENVQLSATLDVNMEGATVQATAESVNLVFSGDDIEIFVQCTDTFCLIPTDDIANAIAGSFVQVFTSGIQSAINTAVADYVNTIATSYVVPGYNVALEYNGNFALFPSTNPNLVIYADGQFQPDSGSTVNPPFSPTVSPPDSVFASPTGQLNFVFTDYLIHTGIWALDLAGDLNFTITNSELPDNSPVHLNTNDATLQSAVPGIRAYPNMDVNVVCSLVNVSSVTVTGNPGINVGNTIYAHFVLTNSSFTTPGWDLLLDIGFDVKLSTFYNTTTLQVEIKPTLGQWAISAGLVKSWLGSVNAQFFSTILEFGLSGYGANIIGPIAVPTPSGFTVGNPQYNEAAGYGEISSDISYSANVPATVCGSGSSEHSCAVGNTCCQWGSAWGCCTYENANCCDSGCCPQGWACDNGDCVAQ